MNKNTIKRAYIRHYSDNGQTTAYIDWSDGGTTGQNVDDIGSHMLALLQRAQREGLTIERETW